MTQNNTVPAAEFDPFIHTVEEAVRQLVNEGMMDAPVLTWNGVGEYRLIPHPNLTGHMDEGHALILTQVDCIDWCNGVIANDDIPLLIQWVQDNQREWFDKEIDRVREADELWERGNGEEESTTRTPLPASLAMERAAIAMNHARNFLLDNGEEEGAEELEAAIVDLQNATPALLDRIAERVAHLLITTNAPEGYDVAVAELQAVELVHMLEQAGKLTAEETKAVLDVM